MQIVSLNEEVRRALYQERLSNIDFEQFLPDLIGQTEVLTDEYRKQLAKHLPARVEGNYRRPYVSIYYLPSCFNFES